MGQAHTSLKTPQSNVAQANTRSRRPGLQENINCCKPRSKFQRVATLKTEDLCFRNIMERVHRRYSVTC